MYNLPWLKQEEIENVNRSIASIESETAIKNFNKQNSQAIHLHKKILSNICRRVYTIPSQTVEKTAEEGRL